MDRGEDVYISTSTFDEMKKEKFFIHTTSGVIEGTVLDLRIMSELSLWRDLGGINYKIFEEENNSPEYDVPVRLAYFDIIFNNSVSNDDIRILIKMFNDNSSMLVLKIRYKIGESQILKNTPNAPYEFILDKRSSVRLNKILIECIKGYSKICSPLEYIITYTGNAWNCKILSGANSE